MSCSCLMVRDRLNCYKPHVLGRDEWSARWEGWQMNQSRSSLLVLSLCNEKDSQAPGSAWVSNLSTKQLSVHLSHCETSRLSLSDCVCGGVGWLCVCVYARTRVHYFCNDDTGDTGNKLIRVRKDSFLPAMKQKKLKELLHHARGDDGAEMCISVLHRVRVCV